jgi:hypothetical protein
MPPGQKRAAGEIKESEHVEPSVKSNVLILSPKCHPEVAGRGKEWYHAFFKSSAKTSPYGNCVLRTARRSTVKNSAIGIVQLYFFCFLVKYHSVPNFSGSPARNSRGGTRNSQVHLRFSPVARRISPGATRFSPGASRFSSGARNFSSGAS